MSSYDLTEAQWLSISREGFERLRRARRSDLKAMAFPFIYGRHPVTGEGNDRALAWAASISDFDAETKRLRHLRRELPLDPTPWTTVNKHTREALRWVTPERQSQWNPREGYEQEARNYPWWFLSDPTLSYPVRRALGVMIQRGFRDSPITFPPVWGYYVAHGEPSTSRKLTDIVETQKILHERFHVAGTYDQRDVALYDATRAFYEYTDPFGAKTYA